MRCQPLLKWRHLTLIAGAELFAMALWFSASAIVPALKSAGAIDQQSASLFTSAVQAGFVAGTLASAFLGLADRIDPRKFFMASALVAAAANAAILPLEPSSPAVVALRFVTGACMAGIYPVGMKLAASWAKGDMGLMVGLLVGALTLGSATPYLFNALGADLGEELKKKGFAFYDTLDGWDPQSTKRVVALLDGEDFDLAEAVNRAVQILSKNKKGFFLMVESNNHSKSPRKDLDRVVKFDTIIKSVADARRKDSLLLFTADHSFDLRLRGGTFGPQLLEGLEQAEAEAPKGPVRITSLRMDNGHTGEEVLAAAQGPGAERIHGFMANTDLFRVMMAAYGWEASSSSPAR